MSANIEPYISKWKTECLPTFAKEPHHKNRAPTNHVSSVVWRAPQ